MITNDYLNIFGVNKQLGKELNIYHHILITLTHTIKFPRKKKQTFKYNEITNY